MPSFVDSLLMGGKYINGKPVIFGMSPLVCLIDRSFFVHIIQQANLGQMSYFITRKSG